MAPTLIVFVDALPYDHLPVLRRLPAAPHKARLVPGFGYSINLHAELFAGLTPDQVGFFGEWTFDPELAPGRRYRWLLPWLHRLLRPYVLNRGLQTILTARYRPGRIMPNIPLARLGDFAIHGEKITDAAFPSATIFTRHPELVVVDAGALAKGNRDAALVDKAGDLVRAGAEAIYVPLPDLDGIGHSHTTTSPEWRRHLEWLDGAVGGLVNEFLGRHEHGSAFVVSDHGMADVRGGVAFDPTPTLGPAGRDTYLYFTDSTLVRLWVFDPRLAPRAADLLGGIKHLRVVPPEERAAFGVANPDFGTVLGVLEEGLCFRPSTFARNIPAAMHGYHPQVSSQHAVLVGWGADDAWASAEAGDATWAGRSSAAGAGDAWVRAVGSQNVMRTVDVFSVLESALGARRP